MRWPVRGLWLASLIGSILVFYFIDSRVEVQLYEYTLHRSLYLANVALATAFVAGLYLSSDRARSAWARASTTCSDPGTSGSTALTSSAVDVPSLAWIEMPS